MKKGLAYVLSIIYYFFFGVLLLFFHPLQWIALKLGGYKAHKKIVDILNVCLLWNLRILGTSINYENDQKIPGDVPLIIVSNHQSMNDIPLFVWYMRKYHPKFISKIELGKGIPSVSFNLKHGGSVLIDRKDPKQSLTAITNFSKYIEKNKYSAVIYPEGTRSRNGVPKRFSSNGLKTLIKNIPSSYVVPVTINNSWKFLKYGKFPMGIGVKLSMKVHAPIKVDSLPFDQLFEYVENKVKGSVITT